jgi:putative phage-type endonuclease
MKRLHNVNNMTEKEWLEHRLKGIGGSDVATILGLNPYKSPMRLYMEKIQEIEPEPVDNEYVELGKELEPVLRKLFTKRTGLKAVKNNYILQHDNYDFMLANLDGEVLHPEMGRGVLEIKTTSEWNRDQWQSETVPMPYMLQVQHYLAVTNYSFGYICVLIGGNKFKHWLIERDEELIGMIISAEEKFWNGVKNLEPPEVIGHGDENDLFNRIWAPDQIIEDKELALPLETQALIEELEALKVNEKELKTQKMFFENRIKELVGKNEKAFLIDPYGTEYSISYKYTKPSMKFDEKRFKEQEPNLYQSFLVPGKPSRRFTITTKGEI